MANRPIWVILAIAGVILDVRLHPEERAARGVPRRPGSGAAGRGENSKTGAFWPKECREIRRNGLEKFKKNIDVLPNADNIEIQSK